MKKLREKAGEVTPQGQNFAQLETTSAPQGTLNRGQLLGVLHHTTGN